MIEAIRSQIVQLKKHKFLFEELVKRDFKKKYKRTVLGMLWSLISPLMQLLVMSVVFTHFFGQHKPHYTIYLFAGNLTYRNARNLHETVLNIPVDRILIETESPFMIPAEFREKKRTMPAYLPSTAKFLAEMLDMDLEALSEQLWTNSCKAFGLPE
jgi:hypothetical protein